MLLEEALRGYLLQLEADGRSEHTRNQYRRHIALLARWLQESGRPTEIAALDHEDIAAFLASDAARLRPDGRPKRPTAMNTLRSSVRTYFAWLHAAGYAPSNPARLVRRARCASPPPRGLSEDEQQRLLDTLAAAEGPEAKRDHALFALMLGTGIRVGSALALDVSDADLEASELTLRSMKNDRPDRIFLPPWVADLLRPLVEGQEPGPLFRGQHGGRLTRRHADRRLKAWLQRAGVERSASPHSLRHSFASRLYRETHDIALVQAALLHRNIASTLVYARPSSDRLRAAVVGHP